VQDRLGVELEFVGVTSSRKMLLSTDGLALDSWEAEYESSSQPADLNVFSQAIGDLDSDAVVFDCTASDAASDFYSTLMESGVHVITPNKKLHSGPLDRYKLVRKLQADGAAHYFYEVWPARGE
jgi:aspartokinase/homoserine dehydrogenase 1